MAIETIGGLGDYNIPDEYSEEDKEIFRQRILLEEELDYQKLHEYKPLLSVLKDEYLQKHGQEFTGDTRELVDDYAWDMSWFESNEASTFNTAMEERSDQQNYDLGLKIHIWDRVHNRDWWKIAKDHTAAIAASPSTLASVALAPVTFGVGGLWLKGGTIAAQQAAKQAVKKSFYGTIKGGIQRNIHKNIVKGVVGEGVVEGAGAGGQEFYRQDVQQQALSPETLEPMREEKDYDDILLQSAIGFSFGAGIPTVLYAGGKGLKAVLKKEMAQPVDQPFGRTPFEELRAVQPEKKTMINKMFGLNIVQNIKRGLTSSAGMPQQLADIHTNHMRKLTAMEEDIGRSISDFEVIFKKETGRDFGTLKEDEMMPYFELLHGKDNLAKSMPNAISDQINLMRTKIADTSKYALDSGMIKDKKLRKTMEAGIKNKDYVNYSYRMYSDDEWIKKLSLEERSRWNEAREYLKTIYGSKKSDPEIEGILHQIVEGSPNKQKILGMLTGRKGIPKEIRTLMGQNIDVRDVYKHSIGKIFSATAEHEFRTSFAEMGGDLGILTRDNNVDLRSLAKNTRDFSLSKEGLTTLIEEEGQKISNPFDGLYGNDAFMTSYKRMRNETARLGEAESVAAAAVSGANGLFSLGHTVYSPITVSRNIAGGGIINMAAGNWMNPIQRAINTSQTGKAAWNDSEMTSFSSLVKRLSRKSNLNEEDLSLIREGIGYGVLQQGVRAEVLQRNLNDFSSLGKWVHKEQAKVARDQRFGYKAARQGKRKFIEAPIRFYGMMDDVNKLWAWDTEFRGFKLAYGNNEGKYFIPKRLAMSARYAGVSIPDPVKGGSASTTLGQFSKSAGDMVEVSEAALKGMAAKKSTMYYPTYDQIPPWIKELRKLPFGNFVAFPTEMIRSTKNSVMLGLEEIYSGNRIMATRGMARLGSTATIAGGFGGGAVGLGALSLSYITGNAEANYTPEQVDAFKRLQPYSAGGDYFFHSMEVKGDKRIVKATNMAYSDPYSVFKEPMRVAMMAYQEGASLEETQSQFLSALGVGAEEFFTSYLGTKEGLRPFLRLFALPFDQEMSAQDMDRFKSDLYKTYTPKGIQDAIGFGTNIATGREETEWGTNVPSMQDYGIGMLGGLRPKEYDLDMSASRKIAKLQKESVDVYADFRNYIKDVGRKDDLSLIPDMKEAYREAIRKDIDIQKQLWGVVRDMRILGMSDLHINNILTQKYDPTREKQKRLSGRKMSGDNAANFLHVQPLYFVKMLDSFKKPLQDLETPIYNELKTVEDEYSRSQILLNE